MCGVLYMFIGWLFTVCIVYAWGNRWLSWWNLKCCCTCLGVPVMLFLRLISFFNVSSSHYLLSACNTAEGSSTVWVTYAGSLWEHHTYWCKIPIELVLFRSTKFLMYEFSIIITPNSSLSSSYFDVHVFYTFYSYYILMLFRFVY